MNLDPSSTDGARNLLLVKVLGGLVVTGVVIGLVVGVLGTTVLRSVGLKDLPPPQSSEPEKVTEVIDGGTDAGDDTVSPEPEEQTRTPRPPTDKQPRSVLDVSPNPAPAGGEITLTGSFRHLHAGTLQVQRREGGTWTDFPVTASLNADGTYSTYIITSRVGTAPYRMLHEATGRTTPVVRITIN